MIEPIRTADLRENEDRLRELISAALVGTSSVFEDVWERLEQDRAQAWSVNDLQGVIVTVINPRRTGRMLWGWIVSGDNMREWLDEALACMVEYGKAHNCIAFEFEGRKGFGRKYGSRAPAFKDVRSVYRMELS